jgi:hypothetical protein
MHRTIMPLTVLACLAVVEPGWAAGLESVSNRQAAAGLKDALMQGAEKAVSALGAQDGFLGNDTVKIPLPPAIEKVESGLKLMGMGKQADELVVGMNRAAEMAVQEAKPVLLDSVKKMSVRDAKDILTGGDDAATQYFRETTSAELTDKFLPIVQKMTARLQLAGQYNQLASQGSRFGLVKPEDANIDSYVTRKALDGLFFMIGEEEKRIRANPASAATSIAKKVFDALGK